MFLPLEVEPDPPLAAKMVLASGRAYLDGPRSSDPIAADTALASDATSCIPEECSELVLVEPNAQGAWTLHDMELRSSASVTVGNSSVQVDVERFKLSLYGPVDAVTQSATDLSIAPGAATFMLAAVESNGATHNIVASNTSRISLHQETTGYSLSALTITVTDDNNDIWTFTIDRAQWSPD